MDRRQFLKNGVAGIASSFAFRSIGTGLGLGLASRANAATIEIFLTAEALPKAVSATKNVLTWQFVNLNQPGPGALNAGLVVIEGDRVVVHLTNNLADYTINLKIPGLMDVAAPEAIPVAPGLTQTYEFIPTAAGSYVMYDDINGLLGRAMGLAAPLVVLPADGSFGLYSGAPANHNYDREYTLMLNELDSRINDAIELGIPANMDAYQPDYFFVNGISYPDTVYDVNGVIDDSKVILMNQNENVAIRFINGGLIYYPMHFHGYHNNVVLRNQLLETSVISKDTIRVSPQECVDTILEVGTQTGLYPLHTHYVPGVTTAGSYAGGGLLLMKSV